MLEGKHYRVSDILVPFIYIFADTFLRLQDDAPFTDINLLYTSLLNKLLSNNYSKGWSTKNLDNMKSR